MTTVKFAIIPTEAIILDNRYIISMLSDLSTSLTDVEILFRTLLVLFEDLFILNF